MLKKSILSVVLIYIVWSVMDFLVHHKILQPIYDATKDLWRPMAEMKMELMYAVTLANVILFVVIYAVLVGKKSFNTGIKYGLLFGLAAGIPMGFGRNC